MEKNIYTQQERNLVAGGQLLERLNKALQLDLLLLELEKSVGLMDGLPVVGAEQEGGKDGQ